MIDLGDFTIDDPLSFDSLLSTGDGGGEGSAFRDVEGFLSDVEDVTSELPEGGFPSGRGTFDRPIETEPIGVTVAADEPVAAEAGSGPCDDPAAEVMFPENCPPGTFHGPGPQDGGGGGMLAGIGLAEVALAALVALGLAWALRRYA